MNSIGSKTKVDCGLIIDGSGSIEKSEQGNFEKVLSFVKDLSKGYEVSKEGTHVGIMVYGDEAKVGLLAREESNLQLMTFRVCTITVSHAVYIHQLCQFFVHAYLRTSLTSVRLVSYENKGRGGE